MRTRLRRLVRRLLPNHRRHHMTRAQHAEIVQANHEAWEANVRAAIDKWNGAHSHLKADSWGSE